MPFLIVFLTLVLSACATIDNSNVIDSSTQRYNALVADLKQTVVVEKISEARAIYLDTTHSAQLGSEAQLVSAIDTAINHGQWHSCLSHSDALLAVNYLNISAHYGAMVCQFESHNSADSEHHQQMLNMILEAIWQTGDGESYDTAFYAINEHDMTAFIEFHGLELHSQSEAIKADRHYLITQLVDPKNQEHFQWFFWLSAAK